MVWITEVQPFRVASTFFTSLLSILQLLCALFWRLGFTVRATLVKAAFSFQKLCKMRCFDSYTIKRKRGQFGTLSLPSGMKVIVTLVYEY